MKEKSVSFKTRKDDDIILVNLTRNELNFPNNLSCLLFVCIKHFFYVCVHQTYKYLLCLYFILSSSCFIFIFEPSLSYMHIKSALKVFNERKESPKNSKSEVLFFGKKKKKERKKRKE